MRLSLPCHTLSYLALPHLTLPYLTLGASPEARFEAAADAIVAKAMAYGRTDPPAPVLGGGLDGTMASLPMAAAPKRKEGELAATTPHPAHSVRSSHGAESVRSVDGVCERLANAEWMEAMDDEPAGDNLPPLSIETAVAEAAMAAAAAEAAAPVGVIDADLVPDPEPSRTNSNVTVEASAGPASAAADVDAYLLDGIDDDTL